MDFHRRKCVLAGAYSVEDEEVLQSYYQMGKVHWVGLIGGMYQIFCMGVAKLMSMDQHGSFFGFHGSSLYSHIFAMNFGSQQFRPPQKYNSPRITVDWCWWMLIVNIQKHWTILMPKDDSPWSLFGGVRCPIATWMWFLFPNKIINDK